MEPMEAQKLSRAAMASGLPHTQDWDIENCMFTLVPQLLDKVEASDSLSVAKFECTRVVAASREEAIAALGVSKAKGKQLMCNVFNGSALPADLSDNEFAQGLRKEGRALRLCVGWQSAAMSHCSKSCAETRSGAGQSPVVCTIGGHPPRIAASRLGPAICRASTLRICHCTLMACALMPPPSILCLTLHRSCRMSSTTAQAFVSRSRRRCLTPFELACAIVAPFATQLACSLCCCRKVTAFHWRLFELRLSSPPTSSSC